MTCAFDLPEAGLDLGSPATGRNQNAGGTYHRIDDVSHPKDELLHLSRNAGVNNSLVELDLSLTLRSLRDRELRGQQCVDARFGRLLPDFRAGELAFSAFQSDFEPLDFAEGNVTRIARIELALGSQFVLRLLDRALGLNDLGFGGRDLAASDRQLSFGFCHALDSLRERGFFPAAVEFEDLVALLNVVG